MDEIKKVEEGDAEAFQKIKRPRLKEFSSQLNGTANSYSLIFKDVKNQTRVWLQNKDENKKERQRPEDNAKTHESLITLPKQSGFADRGGDFGWTWRNKINGGKEPTVRLIIDGLVLWIVIQTEHRMRHVKSKNQIRNSKQTATNSMEQFLNKISLPKSKWDEPL